MSDSAYPGLTLGESIFRTLVWDNAVAAGEAALLGAFPWLMPFRPVIHAVIGLLSDRIFEGARLLVDMEAIRLANAEHEREYRAAFVNLLLIAGRAGTDSPEYQKARDDAKAALSRFAHFGGAPRMRPRRGPQH